MRHSPFAAAFLFLSLSVSIQYVDFGLAKDDRVQYVDFSNPARPHIHSVCIIPSVMNNKTHLPQLAGTLLSVATGREVRRPWIKMRLQNSADLSRTGIYNQIDKTEPSELAPVNIAQSSGTHSYGGLVS
jgi:hypothetical protein